MLVQGRGVAQVLATGMNPEIGKIGKALQNLEPNETFLQTKSALMIRTFAIVGLSLCVVAIALYGLTRGNWMSGFLAGIGFGVASSRGNSRGADRLSRHRGPGTCPTARLTRRMPASEALGSATGFVRRQDGHPHLDQMTVRRLLPEREFSNVDDSDRATMAISRARALRRTRQRIRPVRSHGEGIKALAERYLDDAEKSKHWTHEYSICRELFALSQFGKYRTALNMSPLPTDRPRQLRTPAELLAEVGRRSPLDALDSRRRSQSPTLPTF